MSLQMYLDHYMGTSKNIPNELKRNFVLMRNLDGKVQSLMKKIDKRSDVFLHGMKILTPRETDTQSKKIHNLFSRARQYGDNKVQLAVDSYDLVDKFIGRMDSNMKKFQALLPVLNKLEETKQNKRALSDNETENARRKKKNAGKGEAAGPSTAETDGGAVKPGDLVDMPVDPNEPTYCICNQVSYGYMIGCDNPNCAIEWFHFPCVGLTTKPSGEWYCPKCAAERRAKKPRCIVRVK